MWDYAAKLNEKEQGTEKLSEKFREIGGKVYAEAEAVHIRNGRLRRSIPLRLKGPA